MQKCFISWVQSIAKISEGQIVSIDGKRMCNSVEKGKKAIIHMVSAWSNDNSMVLGQVKVNDKSNEITAIPALLDLLMVKGCWITIDAIGCQKDIAAKIKSKEAEYILAVKDNQEHLHDDIKDAFKHGKTAQLDEQSNLDHGRIEKVFIEFLTRLIKHKQQKIFLVVDGHTAHKTKDVKAWLEEYKNRIELFFLPPYSPELNAQEYVNQDLKTNVIGKKRPINKAQMKNNVEDFMNKRKNDRRQVQKYFHEKHVRYAA